MQPIAHHAEQIQQQAVQVFVAAQQAVVDAHLQLEQLIEYRAEYSSNRVNVGLNALQLRDYQLFLRNLNFSIVQARSNIELRKQQCEKEKLLWLKTRSRSKALDVVIEKYHQQEAVLAARIEQKEAGQTRKLY